MSKLKPLGNRVVVRPASVETKTKSGIYIPDTTTSEKPAQGEVVAVGEGKVLENGNTIPVSVNVGDWVVFSKYAPDEIEVEGEKLLIISEDSLLAIISK